MPENAFVKTSGCDLFSRLYHTEAGGDHQNQNDKNRRQQLLLFADNNFCDDIQ